MNRRGTEASPGLFYLRTATIRIVTNCDRPLLNQELGMRKGRLGWFAWLLVVVAIAGCGSGAGSYDYSKTLSEDIHTEGTQRIQRLTSAASGAGSAIINNARCAKTARPQSYSCIVHYIYHNSEGTYRYKINISGSCDRGGKCRWHINGGVTLIGAEPD